MSKGLAFISHRLEVGATPDEIALEYRGNLSTETVKNIAAGAIRIMAEKTKYSAHYARHYAAGSGI